MYLDVNIFCFAFIHDSFKLLKIILYFKIRNIWIEFLIELRNHTFFIFLDCYLMEFIFISACGRNREKAK